MRNLNVTFDFDCNFFRFYHLFDENKIEEYRNKQKLTNVPIILVTF